MTTITELDYRQVIDHLCPGSFFTIDDNDYSTLIWDPSNTYTKPTESQIQAKNIELINIIAYDHLRMKRDKLLAETDKYTFSDYPHTNDTIKNQWLTYRQALRDITTQTPTVNLETGEISNIIWPTPPS